jgi:hypothetical protein
MPLTVPRSHPHTHTPASTPPPSPTLPFLPPHRALTAEQNARAEAAALRQKEAALQAEACTKTLQNVALRKELHAAMRVSEPSVVQVRAHGWEG